MRPPSGGVFGRVAPAVVSTIRVRMRAIQNDCGAGDAKDRVDAIIRDWRHRPSNVGREIAKLGIASVPYIEYKTRSHNERVRYVALQILTVQLNPRLASLVPPRAEYARLRAAITPIMIRALSDVSPKIRRLAVSQVSSLCTPEEAVTYLRPLLDDPSPNVRLEAAQAHDHLSIRH